MRLKNTNGYTLLELMLIISVIAIAGVVISPFFGTTINGWAIEAETRRVAGKLREAQQKARTEQRNYGIQFDPTNECYNFGYYQSPAWITTETFCITNPAIDLQGTSIVTPARTVYFDHLGAPQSGFLATWIVSGTTKQMRIRVRSATGRVVISPN